MGIAILIMNILFKYKDINCVFSVVSSPLTRGTSIESQLYTSWFAVLMFPCLLVVNDRSINSY